MAELSCGDSLEAAKLAIESRRTEKNIQHADSEPQFSFQSPKQFHWHQTWFFLIKLNTKQPAMTLAKSCGFREVQLFFVCGMAVLSSAKVKKKLNLFGRQNTVIWNIQWIAYAEKIKKVFFANKTESDWLFDLCLINRTTPET